MAEEYLTLKVTLTPLQKGRYRSRIEQSPLGASVGPGCEFSITPKFKKEIESFVARMPGGGFRREELYSFGSKLFKLIFSGAVEDKYIACLAVAKQKDARLRLALAILAEPLLTVPWEYLYDEDHQKGFFIPNHSIIRVIDELEERKAPFQPIRKLLVAIANPNSPIYRKFDAAAHLKNLTELFKRLKIETEILMPATRGALEARLRDEPFDAFYFVGHGRLLPPAPGGTHSMGQLVLEREGSSPEETDTTDHLDATELAGWINLNPSDSGKLRFIYFNSCSTAATDGANSFAGVAQRLMLDGSITAVVAMQTDVQQTAALNMAEAFFGELKRGQSPELALTLARTKSKDSHSWGVPVMYSYLQGPEEFDKNRLACLFSDDLEKSSYGMVLPTFIFGVSPTAYRLGTVKVTIDPPNSYNYKEKTFALKDTEAAWDVISLVAKVVPPERIDLYHIDNYSKECTHLFFFGSKSNDIVASLVKEPSNKSSFRFYYGNHPDPKYAQQWVLEDKAYGLPPYTLDDPSQGKAGDYEKKEDIGIIEKIIDSDGAARRVYFLISGLGDRATRGCGWYLYHCWERLLEEFGGGPFAILLRFPGGQDYDFARRVNRETGLTLTNK
jgi:hypothetical protein